jgi:D-serine deaminase-like pyridoxal phosphate-dependent protein
MPTDLIDRGVIGAPIEDLDTPALLLHWPASKRNIDKMASFFADKPAKMRPHFKNHKCTTLARRQLEAGSALGITCAKLGEAEALAENDFEDILVANQIVGRRKVARLVDLARKIDVKSAVDNLLQIEALSEAATAGGVTLGLLVEVDIGMSRCGVADGEPALSLVREIDRRPGLTFRGIQAYEGHAVGTVDFEERAHLARNSMQKAVNTRQFIEDNSISCPLISGSATATYNITGVMEGVREIQAGSYVTMDWPYQRVTSDFEIALTVIARVISTRPGEAVIDVGVKGGGAEFGTPRVLGHPETEIAVFMAEEHAVIKNAPAWKVGEAVQLITGHCCSTCNLYRQMIIHEEGKVVDVWPIEGSGKLT